MEFNQLFFDLIFKKRYYIIILRGSKMNKKKDFTLFSKILKFEDYTRKYIINSIPKTHCDLRIHLTDELYYLSKNLFYASNNKGNIRMKYLVEMQVNISMIDMLFSMIIKYTDIKKQHIDSSITILAEIKNIIYGWKFNEESKKN